MIRCVVLASGSGTKLQSLLDSIFFGEIPDMEIVAVISSDPEANALTRARNAHIEAVGMHREVFPNESTFDLAVRNKIRDLDADLVIECVKEDMATKKELLHELDAMCKESTIFATNTSSLSVTEMGLGLKHPVIGMHFFNPVPSMKLVEVIRGANTTQETFDFIYNLAKEIGKEPVEVAEAPGFDQ